MGEITFSGLATGMDTDSIITSLMEIERQPLDSLEADKTYLEAETEAYKEFDTKLDSLLTAVEKLDTINDLASYAATSSDTTLLTATTDSRALPGNYDIEIISLAEVQKDASMEGFADTTSPTLSGSLTIGDTTIDYNEISLGDLRDKINAEDTGISAAIIDDGTENGFRLMLTGDEAGVTTEINGSGSIAIDTAANGHTKNASQAHIILDNIDIYSNSNTIRDAIPGVALDLLDTGTSGDIMTLKIATDTNSIVEKVDTFVTAYNDIINWIGEQSDADWGNDSAITSIQRKMQNLLSTQLGNSSTADSLVHFGFQSDYETGTIGYSSETLIEAIETDWQSVTQVFAGDDENDGIMDMFSDYFDLQTDNSNGAYAQRKTSNDNSIIRIEDNIATMERRLDQRESTLRAQYTALEELISTMNSQMSYLDAISTSTDD